MVLSHPDGRLILRLRNGDMQALGELYERYKTRVFRTALAITHDRSAAEDILQECFLRVLRYADSLRTDIPLQMWLYRVAVNQSYTWVQRRKRYIRPLESILGLVAPLSLLPESFVERSELQDLVRRAIIRLPLSHRVVVVLFYLENLSLKEIAEVMEIPEGTVKSRLHYARRTLKKLLSEQRRVPEVIYEFT